MEPQPSEKIPPAPAGQPGAAATYAPDSAPPATGSLSPEEQMALFEKDLKENDWGHQPC